MNLLFQNMVDDRGAVFSDCGKYRYALWRKWDTSKPMVMLIGLNPSTANKTKADKTITRVIDLTKALGYGGFYMMNLFAWITPYPKELKQSPDPFGESNKYFTEVSKICKDVIFCWGHFTILSLYEKFIDRVQFMVDMYPSAYCFGYTQGGEPRHPLMLKKNTGIKKFKQFINSKI